MGNITGIVDASNTLAEKTITFTYDDLNRLALASTTAASTTPFREVYAYNALGNLLSKALGATSTGATNNYALDFENGSSQYASITDGSQTGLDFTDAMSAATWVKFETGPATAYFPYVMKRVASGNQRSYSFYSAGNNLTLDTQYDGLNAGCAVQVSWTPSTGTWYHVAVTKSATSVKFYVNGAQQGSTQTCSSATIYNGTAPFQFGGWTDSGWYGDGIMDDVRVWSRELSSTDVSDLYSTPATFDNGANLQGWWALESAYTDGSGNGNTLNAGSEPGGERRRADLAFWGA